MKQPSTSYRRILDGHMGDLRRAKQLVDAAKDAGAML